MSGSAPVIRHPHHVANEQLLASALLVGAAGTALAFPGIAAGAAATAGLWKLTGPPQAFRFLSAIAGSATIVMAHAALLFAWPLRLALGAGVARVSVLPPLRPGAQVLRSIGIEALAGPALVQLIALAKGIRRRHLLSRVQAGERRDIRSNVVAARSTPPLDDRDHPAGRIRLGVDADTEQPFDLLPEELAQHIFIPGTTNSGKTTTIARLSDGALHVGHSLVIVDCKGSSLGDVAGRLAQRRRLPYRVFSADDASSLGYDICTGDAADVANKLTGAFEYGPNAEVYKNAAMEVIPVIVRALQAAGTPVTLDAIYATLSKGGLGRLGRAAGPPHLDRIDSLDPGAPLNAMAYAGLQRRLGALLEGKFGGLLGRRPAIDWDRSLSDGGVTYVRLSATASSEDVELMGKVLLQDLKQSCARRLQLPEHLRRPALIVFDEFAALRDPRQIVDLLLQAREARMPVLVATQFIPDLYEVRSACLGVGLLIAHRLIAKDAEDVAAQFGTEQAFKPTIQQPLDGSPPTAASIRPVEEYVVHPNLLREMPVGRAAVRAVASGRHPLVQIHRDSAFVQSEKGDQR